MRDGALKGACLEHGRCGLLRSGKHRERDNVCWAKSGMRRGDMFKTRRALLYIYLQLRMLCVVCSDSIAAKIKNDRTGCVLRGFGGASDWFLPGATSILAGGSEVMRMIISRYRRRSGVGGSRKLDWFSQRGRRDRRTAPFRLRASAMMMTIAGGGTEEGG